MSRRIKSSGDWMQLPIDNYILATLSDSGLVLTPAVIAYNIDKSREEVTRRLSTLVTTGLAEKVKRGHYRISNDGLAYLAGNIDAKEIESPKTRS